MSERVGELVQAIGRAAKAALLALLIVALGALLTLLKIFPFLLRVAVVAAWALGIWRAWQVVPAALAPYPNAGLDGITKALLAYAASVPVIVAARIRFRARRRWQWLWGGFLLGAGLMWGLAFGAPRWVQVNPALVFVSIPFLYLTGAAMLLVRYKTTH